MMNNNTSSSANSNAVPSSSSGTPAAPKSIQKTNGTDCVTTIDNSIIPSNSLSNELPCNTCQRSSTISSSTSTVNTDRQNSSSQPQGSSQPLHTNNVSNLRVHPHLSTDEDDGADSDDQYCVYTYKGDGSLLQPSRLAADLPSSFFKLHPSDSSCPPSSSSSEVPSLEPSSSRCCHPGSRIQNGSLPPVNVNQNNNAMYSPDMDFLEMDFDPGGSGDGCCDGDDEDDDEDIVRDHVSKPGPSSSSGISLLNFSRSNDVNVGASSSKSVLNDDQATAAVVLSKLVVTRSNGNSCISSENLARDRSSEPVAHCSKRISNNLVDSICSSSVMVHNQNALLSSANITDEIKLRLVKSVTLPEMGTTSNKISTGGSFTGVTCHTNTNPSSRAMPMSVSAPVFQDKMEGPFPTVIPARKSSEDSMELEVDGVMLWSIQEAQELSVSQIGRSACGATACLNVLSALGCIMTTLSPDFVNNCVGTRVRAEDADLPEYLLSRSNAGATHEDLIAGIHRASNGLIYGRFFKVKPDISPSTLNKWLLHWICKGAVPIASLNLQVKRASEIVTEIPDAWHHQMIFGVTKQGICLTNPLECVPTVELIPQLSSPSVLLVRRDDVTNRKGPRTDLRKLARFSDWRWNDLNVLGQVSNMLLEEMPVLGGPTGLARRTRTSHLTIPADYQAGIVLFIRESNTSSCALLKAAPEF